MQFIFLYSYVAYIKTLYILKRVVQMIDLILFISNVLTDPSDIYLQVYSQYR